MTDHAERPLRADARRNRARVLRTAAEVFATEGLSVPVHEIARRAEVGTGTVSRHFPTKEDLFAAVLLDRMRTLADYADALTAEQEPGNAFLGLFTKLVHEGAAHRGLAEALTGAGFDIEAAAAAAGCDVSGRLRDMLTNAQQAGAIRPEITYADLKALMAGCLAYEGDDLDRVINVVRRGLQ
ncbi:helix-turn-helix transcriptional regulator [Solihabitans fulvus]|uniref:Helix-turn-helix transcriptional regulator n=1 Tax=Solihabitans fulvus TaxID=1892852 RepID=A0A5B2X5V4_9PSEU|nr:TetR/AcrR family transcriptional regulator [Solihabitans fulvus]KAA2258521.1 helix-turn-helix transcriptional regulator [Solihabitans fulvus]